jgi:hypothetical protein
LGIKTTTLKAFFKKPHQKSFFQKAHQKSFFQKAHQKVVNFNVFIGFLI